MIAGKETVTIKRETQTGTSPYGIPYTETVETSLPNCLISWGSVIENNQIEFVQDEINAVVQAPINTVIFPTDIITIRGEDYQVDGSPIKWITPRGFRVQPKLWIQVKKQER